MNYFRLITAILFLSHFSCFAQSCYIPIVRQNKMKWGTCGHPFTQEAYVDYGSTTYNQAAYRAKFQLQLDRLKELGVKYYRIDGGLVIGPSECLSINTANPVTVTENDVSWV